MTYVGWWSEGKQHGHGIIIGGADDQYGEWDQDTPIHWLSDEDIKYVKSGDYGTNGGHAFDVPAGW